MKVRLTILLDEYNREMSNKFFKKKMATYKKSKLPLNNELLKYKEFGDVEVNDRQKRLREISEIIWQI